ncbi:MAG TPA: hypothetical protein VFZ59_00805 [Verrucomicrobiae bacterium]|nr:hypothetical protein [Verrucomicrobiae bacterium]
MTTQEAKTVLLAYRPWADDAPDRETAEAIALCQQDAQLKEWFEKHCTTQTTLRDKFRGITTPDGLQQQILSEYQSYTAPTWKRRPALVATVAAAVLLIAVTSLWFSLRPPTQNTGLAAYRNRMVREVVKSYKMDLETNDAAEIRTYLAQHQSPANYVLPQKLERTPTVGCGALSWQGQPVSMVCFRTEKPLPPGAKSDLFLFVMDDQDLLNVPETDRPVFANVSTMATATWKADGKVYLLAAPDSAELKQRL